MNITGVKIRKIYTTGPVKALVSITVGGDFAVHDLRVVEGASRLFVAMPSRKDESGIYRDIVHPINREAREQIESAILNAYHAELPE